MHFNLDFYSS